jgi:hypothetical protein
MQENYVVNSYYCKDCGIRHPLSTDGNSCPKNRLKNLEIFSQIPATFTGETTSQKDYTEMYNEIVKTEQMLFEMEQKLKQIQEKFYQMRINAKAHLKNSVS